MQFDSGYWTDGANVYRETDFDNGWGENMKGYGFNYGRYREVRELEAGLAHA